MLFAGIGTVSTHNLSFFANTTAIAASLPFLLVFLQAFSNDSKKA
jgi:hypothetical protein